MNAKVVKSEYVIRDMNYKVQVLLPSGRYVELRTPYKPKDGQIIRLTGNYP
jgi:hypothetical protein